MRVHSSARASALPIAVLQVGAKPALAYDAQALTVR